MVIDSEGGGLGWHTGSMSNHCMYLLLSPPPLGGLGVVGASTPGGSVNKPRGTHPPVILLICLSPACVLRKNQRETEVTPLIVPDNWYIILPTSCNPGCPNIFASQFLVCQCSLDDTTWRRHIAVKAIIVRRTFSRHHR